MLLRIASVTSFALPKPKPTLPFWSPTTVSAEGEATTALDDLRGAVELDELLDEFLGLALSIVVFVFHSHS
jgi:hypothetical protein